MAASKAKPKIKSKAKSSTKTSYGLTKTAPRVTSPLRALLAIVVIGGFGVAVLAYSHAATQPLMVFNGGATEKTNYIYTANTSAIVTNTKVAGSNPVFGKNSSEIFYVNKAGNSVYMMNPEGNKVKKVVTPIENQFITQLSWSEAAQKLSVIVAPNAKSGPWTLFTVKANGNDLTNINAPTGLSSILSAVWSPNGKQMLITTNSSGPGTPILDVINADGSGLLQVGGRVGLGSASWSPNGSQFTYTGFSTYTDSALYIENANGTGAKQLASDAVADSSWNDPMWSPDGTMIAYSTYKSDNTAGVSFYNLSTGSTTSLNLGNSCGVEALDWSPNSNAVGLGSCVPGTANNQIYSVAVPNLVPTLLTTIQDSPPAITVGLDWSIQ